ncbi:hypothetical protein NDU88_011306 [Pleurodeles waltl]|uniref:Uncharacterized protein n=1 Tax=Pleurodeles waltl TaxID=8319 RepID=A0AAV7S3C1_PLEWA|nr:hypothetical protein NDU88_011306 [Pleurodeles waltl]
MSVYARNAQNESRMSVSAPNAQNEARMSHRARSTRACMEGQIHKLHITQLGKDGSFVAKSATGEQESRIIGMMEAVQSDVRQLLPSFWDELRTRLQEVVLMLIKKASKTLNEYHCLVLPPSRVPFTRRAPGEHGRG